MKFLCLDTGGTCIKYALSDEAGVFEESGKIPVGSTLEQFLNSVEKLYLTVAPVDGIACSFPGEVHSEQGVIYGISAAEHLHRHNLKQEISKRCGDCKVTMLNDANAAALGEIWKGVGRNYKNIAFVIVGSGIGGAVIENGQLYPGTTRNKAEIGNFLMGGECDGVRLAWSDFTLEKEARKYSKLVGEKTDGKMLVALANQGDQIAESCVEEFLHYMAVGCVNVEFAYDPEIIAIGGGISDNNQLIEGIRRHYNTLIDGQRMGYLRARIEACQNKNYANLLGALYYFLNYELN